MKKIYYFAALAAVAGVMTSCSNEAELASNDVPETATLGINVNMAGETNGVLSRSLPDDAKTGTAFNNGDKIGITVLTEQNASTVNAASGGNVYNKSAAGTAFTYSSTDTKWTTSSPIALLGNKGYVYAYYPSGITTDGASIALDCSSSNVRDVMYATSQDATPAYGVEVNALSPKANLNMHHALAKITIKIKKGTTYTGTTSATITATSTGWVETGKLNYLTGALSDNTYNQSSNFLDLTTQSLDFTSIEQSESFLVVPANAAGNTITATTTIDSQKYSATFGSESGENIITIESGKEYTLSLTIADHNLVIGNVTITDWTAGTASGNGNLEPVSSN